MLYLPASPLRDSNRLASLDEAGLLDRPLTHILDRLTRLGAKVLRVPMTNITLLESDRQIVLSQFGIPEPWSSRRSIPVEDSFCQHVVRSAEPLILADVRRDPLVRNSPLIRDWGVVAYAGLPWRTPDGYVQGAYCAMDVLPRTWTDVEVGILEDLADVVTGLVGQAVALRRASSDGGRPPAVDELLWGHSRLGVYVIQDGRFARVSSRFAEIFGYTPAEILELGTFEALVAEGDRGPVLDGLGRVLDGDRAAALRSFEGRKKTGDPLWLEMDASRTTVDEIPTVVGLLYDVGDRKRSETALEDCEDRLSVLLRATNDLTLEWEIATGEVEWDEKAPRVLRYREEEMERSFDWWVERIHPVDRERVTNRLQALLDGTESFWSEEYRFRRGDGSYQTLLNRGALVRDRRHAPIRLINAIIDVTDRRRMEDGQRMLALVSSVLEDPLEGGFSIQDLFGILVPDFADFCVLRTAAGEDEPPTTELRHVDPQREEILRERSGTAMPTDPLHWVMEEVTDADQTVLLTRLDPETAAAWRIPPEAAETLLTLQTASLLALPLGFHGQVLGALVFGRSDAGQPFDSVDLVLAKNLAQRTAAAIGARSLYREAQRALKARGDIISVVSHDLRNPLATISMAADLLSGILPERREENRRWLDSIRKAAHGMDNIIEDLLDLSRIDTGRLMIETSAQEANDLLREVQQALSPLATQKQIQLEIVPMEQPNVLFADNARIHRVFANLVGNALKFTPEGGRIEIRAEPLEGEIRFSVRDTGPGIPEEQLARVFDRYWQAREGDRRGVGMGLAIARGIVEAHGGRIWAESVVGDGATFYFTLPSDVPSDSEPERNAAAQPAGRDTESEEISRARL